MTAFAPGPGLSANQILSGAKELVRSRVLARLEPRLLATLRAVRFKVLASEAERESWRARIELALSSPDNAHIPRVPGAGRIRAGHQLMHNGVEVLAGGYYGYPIREMLERNGGVHEPQEERIFQEVLPFLPSGGTMLELGAYWGFYSLWFQRFVHGRCILIEPDPLAIVVGKHNFAFNRAAGEFEQAWIGRSGAREHAGLKTRCVDEILDERGISHLDVLHSDIQGAELDMLHGADRLLRDGRVTYVFISTHSNDLHAACEAHLRSLDMTILASVDLEGSFSDDGILVAKRRGAPGPDSVDVARRSR